MSHYTVGVIIKKEDVNKEINKLIEGANEPELNEAQKFLVTGKIIENLLNKALKPFDENMEVESYISIPMKEVKEKFEKIKSYEGDNEYYLNMKNKYKDMTLDEFIREYYCQDYNEEGLMSTYNPNSKWDWYVIGGRWEGDLPIKNKKESKVDNSFCYNNSDDFAQIKDIEFTKELSNEEICEFRITYNELITKGTFYKPEYYQKRYPTFDVYLEEQKVFSTYALLTPDGKWHEPGEMGWFGTNSATPEDEKDFKNTYNTLIKEQNPEDYFVLVDCHI